MYDYDMIARDDESLTDVTPEREFSDDSFEREFNCYSDPNIAIASRVSLENHLGFESYSL